jgi:Zn-dependent protease
VFAFVLLHELGHAIMAQRFGIEVQDIVLLPIGGLARLSKMPEDPRQELVVALAGPAVNLALILVAAPFVVAGLAGQAMSGAAVALPALAQPGAVNFAWFVLAINLSLLLFNMIPAFPMDGGRVLRALLAMKLRYGRATQVAAMIGKVFAILFGVFGLVTGNVSLALVAVFVFMGAGAESQDVLVREHLRGVSVTQAMDRGAPVLPAGMPGYVAFERLVRSPYRALAVVDESGEYVGIVTRSGLQRLWSKGTRGDLHQFVEPSNLKLECDASLDDARLRMAESNARVAPVFCDSRFTGLIDIETIGRILSMRQQGQWIDSRTGVQPTEV